MKTLLRWFLVLLISAQIAQATLRTAQQARNELGAEVWSRIVRIDNADPRNGYPATVFATVFEFDGVLWFYTDANGTQSFSLHRGRLEQEKVDFAPLLQAISPDFVSFQVLAETGDRDHSRKPGHTRLPNGCFIDSLAALRIRLEAGDDIQRAALLSIYVGTGTTQHGHTVLAYETPTGSFLVDSSLSPEPVRLSASTLARDPLRAAQAIMKNVTHARWLPFISPQRPAPSLMAAVTPAVPEAATGA